VIVALAVALARNGQVSFGLAAMLPAVGGLWVAAGSVSGGMSRLPLGPLLSVPLAGIGLGAGLPLLLGALMRPLGAVPSAAMGAASLVIYDLAWEDGVLPYLGLSLGNLPLGTGPAEFLRQGEALVGAYPSLGLLVVLWAAMAGVVSVAEWVDQWALGLVVAVGGGVLGYALAVSETPAALSEAMTSLGLAAIMYGAIKFLSSRAGG
jgi:hypothetical protein